MSNTTIQLKKSGEIGNTPVNLELGEVALNYAEGKLYYKNDIGSIVYIKNQEGFGSISANGLVLATIPNDILTLNEGHAVQIVSDDNTKSIQFSVDETQLNSFIEKIGDGVITGNLTVTGNVTTTNVNAQIVVIDEVLYSGLATRSATPLPNLIAQFTGNTDTYVQVNAQNIDPHGSADFVVTSDVGTDTTFYIDLGIQGSQLNQGAVHALDGYLLVQGNTGQIGGNLIIGTMSGTPGQKIRFINGGAEEDNVIVVMDSTETNVYANLVVGGSITSPTINAIHTDIQTVYDAANNAGGNAFTTIHVNGYTDVVANSKTSTFTIVGEAGVAVGSDSGNNIIAIGANFIGASNLVVDYGTTSEIGYITFDYGYVS